MAKRPMTIDAFFKRQPNKQTSDNTVQLDSYTVSDHDTPDIRSSKTNRLSLKRKIEVMEVVNPTDNQEAKSEAKNQETKLYKPTYYLKKFKQLLNYALENSYNKHLFNEEDMKIINEFENINEEGQKMYVRLIQRKHRWIRLDKIKYEEFSQSTEVVLAKLAEKGFIQTEEGLTDVETVLSLLYEKELRSLMKFYRIQVKPGGRTKMEASLLNPNSGCCSLAGGYRKALLKRTKVVLGKCYKLDATVRRLFLRIILLSSLPLLQEVEEDQGGFEQLFTMLMVERGEKFPSYIVNQTCSIFSNRHQLIQYEEAKTLEGNLLNLLNKKDYEGAADLHQKARENFQQVVEGFSESSLPSFLHKFSAPHIYLRSAGYGIEALQRLKRYKQATQLLQFLLEQKNLCLNSRGHWWERLALNWEVHLKDRQKSQEMLGKALKDPSLKPSDLHSLLSRLYKLCPDQVDQLSSALSVPLSPALPKVTIEGQLVPRSVMGRRNVFMSRRPGKDVIVLGVEEVALQHYCSAGYSCGIHGEGATMCSLFGLFLWDAIYHPLENVFLTPYQATPLDLTSQHFLDSRRELIASALTAVKNSTIQELEAKVQQMWESHHGESSLVSWDLFSSLPHLQGMVACLGGRLIAQICERLATDYRHWRSGAPDLLVWEPRTDRFKFVEVKGPGDHLSSKQTLWLDFLANSCYVPAEVCHIQATGAKKLRKDSA